MNCKVKSFFLVAENEAFPGLGQLAELTTPRVIARSATYLGNVRVRPKEKME